MTKLGLGKVRALFPIIPSYQKRLCQLLLTQPLGEGLQYPGRRFVLLWATRRLPLRGGPNCFLIMSVATFVFTTNFPNVDRLIAFIIFARFV